MEDAKKYNNKIKSNIIESLNWLNGDFFLEINPKERRKKIIKNIQKKPITEKIRPNVNNFIFYYILFFT